MNGISAIAHIVIEVMYLGRSIEFHAGKLGFREKLRLGKPDGSLGARLIYLRITIPRTWSCSRAGKERALGCNDTAINNICLRVDDLDGTPAHHEAVGIPLLPPEKQAVGGNWPA